MITRKEGEPTASESDNSQRAQKALHGIHGGRDPDAAQRQKRLKDLDDESLEDSKQDAHLKGTKPAGTARTGLRQQGEASVVAVHHRKPTVISPADRLLDRLIPLVDEALDILWERTTGAEDLHLPGDVDPGDLDSLLGIVNDWVNQLALNGDMDWELQRNLFSHSTQVLLHCLTRGRHEHDYDVIARASKLALRAYEEFTDRILEEEEQGEVSELKQVMPYWKMKRLVAEYEVKRARRSKVETRGTQSSRPSVRAGESKVVILLWAASPLAEERVLFDSEKNELQTLLRRSKVTIEDRLAARPNQLSQSIWQHEPDIIHFSGHGRNGRLVFEGEDGDSAELTVEEIEDLFRRAVESRGGKRIRCVVLNACYSADIAEVIAKHVDCVIGTPYEIEDPAAIDFSKGFYEAISWAESVKTAFDEGIARLHRDDTELPELKVRDGVDADHVWFLNKTARQ